MKASKDILEQLHDALAAQMLKELGGEVPLTASHWSAIAKFLKDNGIDSLGDVDDPSDAFAKLVRRAQEATSNMTN